MSTKPALYGELGIVLALAGALLAIVALAVELMLRAKARRVPAWLDGRRALIIVVAGVALSVGSMQDALITHDFAVAYVAANNATVTPLLYSITGMWSALEGSILLWVALLTVVTVGFVVVHRRRREDPVYGWAALVLCCVEAFFLFLVAGPATPFPLTQGPIPTQGAGPNSLLQDNPLVAIHPPLIYAGLVGFTVPFAIVVGTLVSGRVHGEWQAETRRWALGAWSVLTVGILLGAWWSYQVLGWGGFWAWDPVENAALLPWLVGTAFVHSVVVEERRGLFRVWNATLAIAVFALTILATYFTRSGVLVSVHSFSPSSLGPILLGFLGLVLAVGLSLLAWRGDRLRAPVGIDEPLSREGAFVLNNLLFVGFAVIVLLGTVFPLAYEAVRHQQVTIGPPYYDTVAVPVGLCVLCLMAVAPLLGWRHADAWVLWRRLRASAWVGAAVLVVLVAAGVRGLGALAAYFLAVVAAGSALRTIAGNVTSTRRRRAPLWHGLVGRSSGGMVVHLGVVLAMVGIVSSVSFATRAEVTLAPGQTKSVAGHTVQYLGIRVVTRPVSTEDQLVIRVDGSGLFYPGATKFAGTGAAPVGTPAIDSSVLSDVYLTYDAIGVGTSVSGPQIDSKLPKGWVLLGVTVEPLVVWLWAGGIVAGLGGLLAIVPGGRRRTKAIAAQPTAARVLEAV